MDDEHARAVWQSEPCPPWCSGEHHDDDHPDDRYHDSPSVQVPVTVMERDHAAGPGRWIPLPGEITIITSQHADTGEMVTFIGRADRRDQQLHLTPDGAARLAREIVQHLATINRPG
jgi:hypothetical protein